MEFNNVFTEERYEAIQNLSLDALKSLNLNGANLSFCDLKKANLAYCKLNSANLRYADLSNANLSDAYCSSTDFRRADLTGTDLRKTDLKFARFGWSTLEGTKFDGLQYIAEGNGKELVAVRLDQYQVVVFYPTKKMAIGCLQYSFKEWFSFSDEVIAGLGINALSWWKDNLAILQGLCKRKK